MFKLIIEFIKYNNLFILILAIIFIVGSGVFAQTETGQALIGEKAVKTEGIDNTLLLNANLDNLAMDYKIEKIEQDEKYYYVTYTYIDIVKKDSAWEYQMEEKVRKVSKKLKEDLGVYMAKELSEEKDLRIKDLKAEQARASAEGVQVRQEITEYSGLIGGVLDTAAKVFPGYEPVKTIDLPSPSADALLVSKLSETGDYDKDGIVDFSDNCPADYNPEQVDADINAVGDVCDIKYIVSEILAEDVATSTITDTSDIPAEEPTPDNPVDIVPENSGNPDATTDGQTIIDSASGATEAPVETEPDVEIIDEPLAPL